MFDLARKRTTRHAVAHGGWGYDAYPDEPMLDAGTTITIADIEGPGVITRIHSTQPKAADLFPGWSDLSPAEQRTMGARGIVLEVLYDGAEEPSISVPLGDFFGDGCGGRCISFSTPFVEKVPDAYNCAFPMPFRERVVVRLRNDTPFDMLEYMAVEHVLLDEWDPSLWQLHAQWERRAFQLDPDSDEQMLRLDGPGHLIGQSWSITTDEPHFTRMTYVMEGNNEYRLDGASEPAIDYTGTEDAFGFSWGFQEAVTGLCNGIPYVSLSGPSAISVYRFRTDDAICWERSLDLRIDWTHEQRTENYRERIIELVEPGADWLPPSREAGGGWIDYAMTTWWYAPAGTHRVPELPPLDERVVELLHPNPPKAS
jgi:hypothetical protein